MLKDDGYLLFQACGRIVSTCSKMVFLDSAEICRTTPYVSADGSFLIYASVNKSLHIMICHRKGNVWGKSEMLVDHINKNGQGNSFGTVDNRCLFFAAWKNEAWDIRWVKLKRK